MPHGPARRDLADDRQNQVLGGGSGGDRIDHLDLHGLGPAAPEALHRQHVRDLGGADTESVGAQRPVGGGVGVRARNHQTGLGDPLLRPHDVEDALADVAHAEQFDVVVARIPLDDLHHVADFRVRDGVEPARAVGGRHVVIRKGEGLARVAHRPALAPDLVEGVEGVLLQQQAVDVDQALAVLALGDDMLLPDLVENRLGVLAVHPCWLQAVFGSLAC